MVGIMGAMRGNIFLLLVSMHVFFVDARVSMEARTADGLRCESAVMGQPFLLEVTIDNVYGSVQTPTIEGIDTFFAKRTGTYMSSVNGKSTTKYTYQIRIDEPGTYTLGPAYLTHQQQNFVSNTVKMIISKDVPVVTKQKNTKQSELKVFLRLMVDADHVVVGQKITGTLRFYYQDAQLNLAHIGQPELTNFDVKKMGNPVGGTVEVDGASYRYAEWKWDMYPTKAGEFLIPAYNADYELPVQNNRMLGGFFMFVNARADRKRVYSNAVKMTVDPLPPYDGRVDAIGTFENITASIKPAVAKQGEGMVLQLTIEGKGNMEALAAPVLIMPEGLKYYDSNSSVSEPADQDQCVKKQFEFIVQGMKVGDWEIPAQQFTYFDIEKKSYITVRTAPLGVSIMPSAYGNTPPIVPNIKNDTQKVVVIQEDIMSLNTAGPWYPTVPRRSLPWWLFHFFVIAPLLYIGYPFVLKRFMVFAGNSPRAKKRRAVRQARKDIQRCLSSGENKNLCAIFNQLLVTLYGQRVDGVSYNGIQTYIDMVPFTDEELRQWNDFLHQITQAAYAASDNMIRHDLGRMAEQWIQRLEKLL
jgi:oxygen tolerance protein BatD